jgi:hypothetical protein
VYFLLEGTQPLSDFYVRLDVIHDYQTVVPVDSVVDGFIEDIGCVLENEGILS